MSVVKPINAKNKVNTSTETGSVLGSLVALDDNGAPLVSFENDEQVFSAKSALSREDCAEIQSLPAEVVINFEQGDRSKPVITALVREKMFPLGEAQKDSYAAELDGKRLELSARDEIKLQCGKSSILLRKDGKIVIKGANLISRSSASNKIKGGSVSIN